MLFAVAESRNKTGREVSHRLRSLTRSLFPVTSSPSSGGNQLLFQAAALNTSRSAYISPTCQQSYGKVAGIG